MKEKVLVYEELHCPSLADRRKGFKVTTFSVIRPESRNPSNFYPIHARTETFKNSCIPSTIGYWNSLNISNRFISFIKSLMYHVKSPLLYYGNREKNIKHANLLKYVAGENLLDGRPSWIQTFKPGFEDFY